MDDKGEIHSVKEEDYLKISIKESVDECSNIDLLYLINSLLREDAMS